MPDGNFSTCIELSNLKVFADDNFNVTQNIKFVYHMVEKGENAGPVLRGVQSLRCVVDD